jgi:N-acetylmuramoyl-L-alanine amidase
LSRESLGGPKQTAGLLVFAFVLGVAYVIWMASGAPDGSSTDPNATSDLSAAASPTQAPRPTSTPHASPTVEPSPSPNPTPGPWKVGVVAGHWKSDAGAVCDDGLQEVTINLDIASRVVAVLQYEGYEAELLPEFSDQLEASGFKVARVAASAIPEQEDRLVACLIREYGESTGLPVHEHSITYDMTVYHAFSEIHPETPAAIIELGFMGADREMLTENAFEVARGVVRGIVCFLEGE